MLHQRAINADGNRPSTVVDGRHDKTQSRDYDCVRRAIEFLNQSWTEQPGLDALAAHLHLSTAHTQKMFKRWCGLSPKEFVQAITLDHARGLLEGSSTVLDTAHQVGLSGPGRLHDLFVSHEAMTPGDYSRRGEGVEMSYGFHPSPFGLALVMATLRGVAGLAFCDGTDDIGGSGGSQIGNRHARAAVLDDMKQRWPRASYAEIPAHTEPHARQIFDPAHWRRESPVRLVLIGSDFEVRVWQALLTLPMGAAVSYGDLARHLCMPGGARAVGSAVGRNPISFVVPCHRVLRSDGGLGGYHWGVTRKLAILGWEKGHLAGQGAPE